MPKYCKIIATYFGVRRTYPYTHQDTITILKDSLQNEIELDPGVDNLDIIFVNHDCGIKEANDFLDSLEGTKTFAGTVKVIHRPWENGIGMSMGSLDYGYKKLRDQYEYFFFQEDDYKVVKKDYYIKGVKVLESDPKIAFVGYDMIRVREAPNNGYGEKLIKWIFYIPLLIWGYKDYVNRCHSCVNKIAQLRRQNKYPYAGGMMGVTHKKYLDEVIELRGKLPYPELPNPRHNKKFIEFKDKSFWSMVKTFFLYNRYMTWYWLMLILAEVEFTRVFYDVGYEVTHYPEDNRVVYSYKWGGYKTTKDEKLNLKEDLFTNLDNVD